MCGIAGLFGDVTGFKLIDMLKELEHRGPDGSGTYVDGQVSFGTVQEINPIDGSVALGQNLLSIVGSEVQQPIFDEKRVLVSNGEIYNYQDIKNKLNYNFKTDSDCEVILALLNEYKGSLIHTIPQVISQLDGDYAFVVYDGTDWAAVRDPVGVKPLFFGKDPNNDLFGVASERKALWRVGIQDVESLNPNLMLYNQELHRLPNQILRPATQTESYEENLPDYSGMKSQLKNLLVKSVAKRISDLDKVGIIFSGGVDSTILTQICLNLGVKPELYTVGKEGSADLEFSLKAAQALDTPIYTHTVTVEEVKRCTPLVLEAIEEWNIMKLGVGMTAYMASEVASQNGLRVVLSGQGADELFGGYHRYLKMFEEKGTDLQSDLWNDIQEIYQVNLERDDAVTMAHSVELRVPYLDLQVINMAMDIPISYKISNVNDQLRKCILRDVARELNVPEFIVNRPKKAAQYGSGIHQLLVKKVLKDQSYVDELKGSVNFIEKL
ncbi:MAG TPA: asparagine synthetase B [Methanobacteriaceae archaeon]|nr:asparagine synthetase B [Methanobacteriaceae archaeon]